MFPAGNDGGPIVGDMKRRTDWRRAIASGALWAVVYNTVWGSAWFAFMRAEWADAVATIDMEMPWSAEVWFGWAVLTVVIGAAVMAYASSGDRVYLRSLTGSVSSVS